MGCRKCLLHGKSLDNLSHSYSLLIEINSSESMPYIRTKSHVQTLIARMKWKRIGGLTEIICINIMLLVGIYTVLVVNEKWSYYESSKGSCSEK